VEAHGKTVGLIAQAPQQLQPQLVGIALQRRRWRPAGTPPPAAWPGSTPPAPRRRSSSRRASITAESWPLPPSIITTSGQSSRPPVCSALAVERRRASRSAPSALACGPAAEATPNHLRHAHEVVGVAGAHEAALNLVLAVVLLGRQPVDEHHLRGHRRRCPGCG
jgi:hypothetical protein